MGKEMEKLKKTLIKYKMKVISFSIQAFDPQQAGQPR